MPRLSVVVLGAALFSVGGCNVFDAKLWMDAVPQDAAPSADAAIDAEPAEADAGPDTPPPGPDAAPMVLADRCENAPVLMSQGMMTLPIDTSTLTNDYTELAACAGHDLPGNDGFVSVQMMAGEKWHVHVNPIDPQFDPAVYILSSCDTRACSTITAMDECGPGKSEHLSFIAPETGMFRVGVDSSSGGGKATMVLVKPVCGNGMVEHSETCDDGNTMAGDGCDSLCRKELSSATVTETEPNDDRRAANVLGLHQPTMDMPNVLSSISVTGAVGTRCDHDMYSVTLTQTGTIRASVVATGIACGADGAPVKLTLLASDGLTPVNAGLMINADCPSIEAGNLPAGEYFLMVRRPGGDALFAYQLMVETP